MSARELLAEVQARADAATAGEWTTWFDKRDGVQFVWRAESMYGDRPKEWGGIGEFSITDGRNPDQERADAEFVAAARTDVPRLVGLLVSILDYVEEFEDTTPEFEDGRPDPILLGIVMAATDIRNRFIGFAQLAGTP